MVHPVSIPAEGPGRGVEAGHDKSWMAAHSVMFFREVRETAPSPVSVPACLGRFHVCLAVPKVGSAHCTASLGGAEALGRLSWDRGWTELENKVDIC